MSLSTLCLTNYSFGLLSTVLPHIDARGSRARCAAVLFSAGKCFFTDGEPSPCYMNLLEERRDNQIMSLEIMAIAVGLSTFAEELKGRKVVVYSDNTGAEVCVTFRSV